MSNKWKCHSTLLTAALVSSSLLASPIFAQTVGAAEKLNALDAATSLQREDVKPWHLRMSFTLNDMSEHSLDEGTIDVRWSSLGGMQTAVESKLLHGQLPDADAAFRKGLTREIFLIRELVSQTTHPVGLFHNSPNVVIAEQVRKFGKVELQCFSVTSSMAPAGTSPGEQFCVEPASPDVLRLTFLTGAARVRNRSGVFQNKNVALDNVISYNGHIAITGHTETLETVTPAVPNESAESNASSDASDLIVSGHMIGGDPPSIPMAARANHVSDPVVLAFTIDKQGHVKDIAPIYSPGEVLTGAFANAVSTWTYTPSMRVNVPVETSTTITFSYSVLGR